MKVFNFYLLFFLNSILFCAEFRHVPKIIKADHLILKKCSDMAEEFYQLFDKNKFIFDFLPYFDNEDVKEKDQIIQKFSKILCNNKTFILNFGEHDTQAAESIIRNLFEINYKNNQLSTEESLKLNIYLTLVKLETADFNF